jgi:hypothetical protein
MYIPFFGISKYWAIQMPNGQKYEVPYSWKPRLEEIRKQYKVQWYFRLLSNILFFLLLLSGAFAAFSFVMMSIEQSKMTAQREQDFQNNVQTIETRLNQPSRQDFYNFQATDRNTFKDYNVYYKVEKITDTSLFLVSPYENPLGDIYLADDSTTLLKSFFEDSTYRYGFWVPRNFLSKDYEKNVGKYELYPGKLVIFLPNHPLFTLQKIIRTTWPAVPLHEYVEPDSLKNINPADQDSTY